MGFDVVASGILGLKHGVYKGYGEREREGYKMQVYTVNTTEYIKKFGYYTRHQASLN